MSLGDREEAKMLGNAFFIGSGDFWLYGIASALSCVEFIILGNDCNESLRT